MDFIVHLSSSKLLTFLPIASFSLVIKQFNWISSSSTSSQHHFPVVMQRTVETGTAKLQSSVQHARGIREGFAVGCRGTGRWPMMSPNHKTAVVHGKQLVDTMATWMIKKLAAGPYTLSELPWTEDIIKQSPISVALKPSGEQNYLLSHH